MALKKILRVTQAQWTSLETNGYFIDGQGVRHDYDAEIEYDVRLDTAAVTQSLSSASTHNQVPTAKTAYDTIHPAKESSIPSGGLLPNILYALGTLSGAVTISLATPADSNICNHYFLTFETGATAPTITWDASITSWMGGSAPTINANKHYEVSILNGVGVAMEV